MNECAFDAVGNRTSSHLSASYTTTPFNRTTTATGINQTFDSNGNTATRTQSGASWTYTWDRENRLTQASSTGATVNYVYDALGRRVRRTEGANDTKFTHDGQDVILDDVASTLTKYQNGPGIDNKLSVKQGSTTSYVLADHLGSTDAFTDSTGAVTASQTYDSFGNGSNGSFPSRYQFTGREFDPTLELQFSRARFYDPKLGRFMSEDPIGFAGMDVNLYGYVHNNPRNRADPLGLIDLGWGSPTGPPIPYSHFPKSEPAYVVINGEVGGNFHGGFFGYSASYGVEYNLSTGQVCIYRKWSMRTGLGIFGGGGAKFSLGDSPVGQETGGTTEFEEAGLDIGKGAAAKFRWSGPGSVSTSGGDVGVGVGPGVGLAAGADWGQRTNIKCWPDACEDAKKAYEAQK